MHDLRFSLRQLAKSPGFTAVAIVTLALAIGVNSAVFALIDAMILRPVVPLRPDEVVNLFNGQEGAARNFRRFSHAEYLALREARDTFASVAATSHASVGVGNAEGGMHRAPAIFTTENFFSMLGVQPAKGRFYTADECLPNAGAPVVVAGHALWQRLGGGDDFVGRTLQLNGKPFTVIGVAPEGFNGTLAFSATDLWLPLGVFSQLKAAPAPDLAAAQTYALGLTARLAPGLDLKSLSPRLAPLAQRLTALQVDGSAAPRLLRAETPSRQNISAYPSNKDPSGPVAIALFSMAGCVLLIACLNLANMLLARSSGREKEIALRLALGASRGRIVRQLVIEGLLLALGGGVAGLLLATWGNTLLVHSFVSLAALSGDSIALDVGPDIRVIGTTFAFCLLATLGFSLGPALKAARTDLLTSLKRQGGESGAPRRLHRFFSVRHCLVMGQLALSLMLVFSAALFLRGALKATAIRPGFDPTGTLVADFDYALTLLDPAAVQRSLFATVDHLAAQPGVQAVAAATFVPYSSRLDTRGVRTARETGPGESGNTPSERRALYVGITTGYFDAVGAPLIHGRDFTAAEARAPGAARVAIIDTGLAQKLFPGGSALGEFIRIGSTEMEVIGICAPHRHNNRASELSERVFIPYAATPDNRVFLLVRHAVNDAAGTAAAIAPLRAALRAHDPGLPLLQMRPFSHLVDQDGWTWIVHMGALVFGLFGAIALLLAVVGVYGVKAYMVAQRTREIGIRMAIGAQPRDVFELLLKQGALQVAVALAGGVLLAFAAGKILANILYQVSPVDPLALGGSALLLAAAALLACFVPARRATKIDPVVALRAE